jgi:serine-type D-Ala-D-Ala carboxypeptidase (penicillin-binding protein 5/6)
MTELYKNFSLALFSLAVTATAFGMGVYGAVALDSKNQSASVAESVPTVTLADNALIARAAVLYDLGSSRVLYQKNANEALPLASLTKLMAVETVLSQRSPNTLIQITQQALRSYGDSGLKAGETVELGDLIKFALVASSNDAMEAAAGSLGEDPIVAMNAAAQTLGLSKTHFNNATGLDVDARTSGAYGSAYDVARLAGIFYKHHPNFFELTTKPEISISSSQRGKELTAEATALPLQSIPGFVAAKTGYTDLAGGNLVAVFDLEPGRTVIAAVLGSTRNGRFSDIETLIKTARQSL